MLLSEATAVTVTRVPICICVRFETIDCDAGGTATQAATKTMVKQSIVIGMAQIGDVFMTTSFLPPMPAKIPRSFFMGKLYGKPHWNGRPLRANFPLDSETLIRILIIVLNFNQSIIAYHDYHQGTIAGIRFDA
jgi:hypothetical protein